ncbi:hypothetical protein KCG44_01185 [Pacificimonas sp. WHA3]|uniref:Transmembrane protein n=1 Tax=Pacificimonas pallii TaxID=2827236 RepID=A0ABS6SB06_9SPHN|nr:hypothetical protein [Pacificimonas pallii]MBV7255390.1 hypothetical protein [Pacificimonas pallii]
MNDAEETVGLKVDERDPDLLLYDFLKYLATIALLILGAVLSLAGPEAGLTRRKIGLVIIVVAAAAFIAIVAADRIVKLRAKGMALDRWVHWSRGACMWLLALGTGFFLSHWINGLD